MPPAAPARPRGSLSFTIIVLYMDAIQNVLLRSVSEFLPGWAGVRGGGGGTSNKVLAPWHQRGGAKLTARA